MQTVPNTLFPAAMPERVAPLKLTPKQLSGYRLLAAIEAARLGDWYSAGFERELSNEEADRHGKPRPDPHTLYVPDAIWSRDLTTTSATGGGYTVGTDVMGFVEILRARRFLTSGLLGAELMTGLKQNQAIARQGATVTTTWAPTEASAPTETTTLTLGQLSLSPKTVTANIELSRLIRLMSAGLAERLVMNDIQAAFAVAVDTAAINGAAASGEPAGLLQTSGVGSFSGTTLAYATLLGAQRAVLTGNGIGSTGELAWITTPTVAETLANRQAFSANETMWRGKLSAGELIGCPAYSSTIVPTGRLIGGDWSQMIIAQWGPLELRGNPYANFQAGITGVTGFLSVDIGIKYATAFTASTAVT